MASTTRRDFLKTGAAVGTIAASTPAIAKSSGQSAIVVGAGIFGLWSAFQLQASGYAVTLIDAWGPGNERSSSGGESRIIRATYGPKRTYFDMVLRAMKLWKMYEKEWGTTIFHPCGMLWFTSPNDSYEQAALPMLREAEVQFEVRNATDSATRWPQINFEGVSWTIYEPDAGYLDARTACAAIFAAFRKNGGKFVKAFAKPGQVRSGAMDGIVLSSGSVLKADAYVFACGPWLGQTFDFLKPIIRANRQEVYFFGTPEGMRSFDDTEFPVWIDNGEHIYYGMPASNSKGFKIANDVRGPVIDPTSEPRTITEAELKGARDYLELRFPQLADAPLLESRVCQYEAAPRDRFIIDRHPEASNAWIAGGGSGHGFKHSPVVGEIVRDAVSGIKQPPEDMSLSLALETYKSFNKT